MSDTTNILGESVAVQGMLAQVSALAPLNRPVLIWGERGTGKELVAHRLNFLSPRWNRPFLTLNCGALSESVLDSELFGHEAGAFTGAARRRASRFEVADGGTVFLDEIGNAPAAVQERLLRVIEYGTFERVGGNETVRVDVRVIAGTNVDLRGGGFRADLLDRLAFDVVRCPPLRERGGDVMVLARHFAQRMTAELKRDFFAGFSARAAAVLEGHDWPGNVRELRNVVERSVCRMTDARRVLDEVVLDPFGGSGVAAGVREKAGAGTGDFRALVAGYEKGLIEAALVAARFNQRQAAAALGLGYHQFRGAMRRLGVGRGG